MRPGAALLPVLLRVLPLVLSLGACGARGPAPRPDTPDEAACRAEAMRSDEIGRINRGLNPSDSYNQARVAGEIRQVVLRGMRDCLRRRGLPLPGGVEPERPTGF